MKKLLWFLCILLLLGLGFLYIIKNPKLPIAEKILTTLNIDIPTSISAADISGCLIYFDGCNNCLISWGVIDGCTKMYCEIQTEPRCLEYASWTEDTGVLQNSDITSVVDFQSCMDAGNPIMESYPRQCAHNWTTYTEIITEEPTACTMEYMPVCASVAIQCVTTPCDPIQQTFSNKCMMNANKLATFLHDGECWSVNR